MSIRRIEDEGGGGGSDVYGKGRFRDIYNQGWAIWDIKT